MALAILDYEFQRAMRRFWSLDTVNSRIARQIIENHPFLVGQVRYSLDQGVQF